ncbi:hypothetical protein PsorP6_008796 [Peronosclerospora sorghi]|uniref:Uncharacterized protein n=1 Tax=Peronosclerospora sorghi TaxID=230839 RepID=A0ACC0W246_9STRA|nr:hypothetical protein PsorP6_008796 [Peronosclerospora sorghi]
MLVLLDALKTTINQFIHLFEQIIGNFITVLAPYFPAPRPPHYLEDDASSRIREAIEQQTSMCFCSKARSICFYQPLSSTLYGSNH